MKIIGRELQERNRYIEALNKSEANINSNLSYLKIKVMNPATIVKRKIYEMEELFHQQEMEFYTNLALGQVIRVFLLEHLSDTINNNITKIINFESLVTINGIRLPIKNPFIEGINKRIEEIKKFRIDETLPETIGKYMTNENLENILFIDNDLIKLGYSDLAETAVERTLNEMQKNESRNKKNQKTKNSILK